MKVKDKIIYASYDQVPSFKGASTHILSTCRDAYRFDQEIHLVSLGEQTLPSSSNFKHIPFNIHEKNYLVRAQKFQVKLNNYLVENKFCTGHFRGPFEGEILLNNGIKCIYEVNSMPSFELPYLYGRLPEGIHHHLMEREQFCLEKSEHIICPSIKIKEFILNRYIGIDSDKITVIENGCDLSADDPKELVENETVRLVYIGTLHPWQGLTWLLKVLRDYPLNVQLDIYPSSLKKWSKLLIRNIKKYGLEEKVNICSSLHKGQIHETLKNYHYGIAPLLKMRRNHVQGCCPVKIKDYLACGLPVIAPDLDVVTNLVKHNQSGLIYEVGKINSLGALLGSICDNSKIHKDIALYNKENKDQVFTWEQYNDRLFQLVSQLS